MEAQEEQKFSVYAEAEGFDRPLIVIDLPFPRVIDDIVVPFEGNEPFFIDGAPLTRTKIRRLKILQQKDFFRTEFNRFNHSLKSYDARISKTYGEQYHVRLEALLRWATEDVTTQIIKAFDTAIKPSLRDYLPKRDELIQAATIVFIESIKKLSGS